MVNDLSKLNFKGDMDILRSTTPNLRIKIFTRYSEIEPKFLA